jgi:hypothetical protein
MGQALSASSGSAKQSDEIMTQIGQSLSHLNQRAPIAGFSNARGSRRLSVCLVGQTKTAQIESRANLRLSADFALAGPGSVKR